VDILDQENAPPHSRPIDAELAARREISEDQEPPCVPQRLRLVG
jgi:hypothetical protein